MPHDYDDGKLKRALERHPHIVEIAHRQDWTASTICNLTPTDKERVIKFFRDAYDCNPTTIQMWFALRKVKKMTKDFRPWAMTDAEGRANAIYDEVSNIIRFNTRTTKEQRMCLTALIAICQRRGQVIEQLTK